MELDNLKAALESLEKKVDANAALQQQIQNALLEPKLRRLNTPAIWDLVGGLVCTIWSGSFLADHFAEIQKAPLGAGASLVIFIFGIVMVSFSARQLAISSQISLDSPIVESQNRLAELRMLRLRSTQWAFLVGLPLWFVFPMFLFQALVKYEVALQFSGAWVVVNIIVGIVAFLILMQVARKTQGKSKFLNALEASATGSPLIEARAFLADLAELQRG